MLKYAMHKRLLIAIDDTDNHESRGTGYLARLLGKRLADEGFATVRGITRHQLFIHPSIPYTSHNSALCLDVMWHGGDFSDLAAFCRNFLLTESAEGSDAGLCITPYDDVPEDVADFGRRAKTEVLVRKDAMALAVRYGLLLEGLTGDHGGVIGAIASVGLRKSGNDGRFVWVEGVREISGVTTVRHLLSTTGIDVIRPKNKEQLEHSARVRVEPWPRPVLMNDQAVLLVEKMEDTHDRRDWKILSREVIRQY